eukprot:TRINITY_DN2418_c0_g1_i4.p1 TRINITY_DN2418_c0_g1~~TRINITY_DN2418_c0_g1_i4.p1  ORF type:complete len:433 (-),score=112.84 TRINITY_DN2418_c0_g1_i4:150-1448(-)
MPSRVSERVGVNVCECVNVCGDVCPGAFGSLLTRFSPSPTPPQSPSEAKESNEPFEKYWKENMCEVLFPNPAGTPKEREPLSERELRMHKIFQTFDDPHSSTLAMGITVWIMTLIFASTITFCVETLPQNHGTDDPIWFIFESIAVINFTIEYLVRIVTCPSILKFVPQPLNLIDLFAILPYYIDLMLLGSTVGGGFAVIRVIRLARVFRIFKVSKYARGFILVGKAMARSTDALKLLVFLLGIAMVVFASAMFYAESSGTVEDLSTHLFIYADGSQSPYQSIPDGFWWALVTMTTVGYGDNVPKTPFGKLVAVFCMLSGILILAFPITVIGSAFAEVWDEEKSEAKSRAQSDGVRIKDIQSMVERLETMRDQFKPEVLEDLVPFFVFSRTMFNVNYQVMRSAELIAKYDERFDEPPVNKKHHYGPNFPIPM